MVEKAVEEAMAGVVEVAELVDLLELVELVDLLEVVDVLVVVIDDLVVKVVVVPRTQRSISDPRHLFTSTHL